MRFLTHPNIDKYGDLCIPCCGIKPPKSDLRCGVKAFEGTVEQYLESKASNKNDANDQKNKNRLTTEQSKYQRRTDLDTEKYVMNEFTFPLPEGRLGKLPAAIIKLMSGKEYPTVFKTNKEEEIQKHSKAQKNKDELDMYKFEKSTHINKSTRTFLRKGLPKHRHSFLNCLVHILQNPSLLTVEDLINSLVEDYKLEDFIFAHNGMLCKSFLPLPLHSRNKFQFNNVQYSVPNYEIHSVDEFSKFKIFFLNVRQKSYVNKFNLMDLYKEIAEIPVFNGNPSILKEFIIYKSFQAFKEYLLDDNVLKTHDLLLSLFFQKSYWASKWQIRSMNIMIFEIIENKPVFTCPYFGKTVDNVYSKHKPFIFLFKRGDVYEPIHFVKFIGSKMESTPRIEFDVNISKLLFSFKISCEQKALTKTKNHMGHNFTENGLEADSIISSLNSRDKEIKYQIIDYSFHLIGFVIEGHVFIPLKFPAYMKEKLWRSKGCMFIDTMYRTLRPRESKDDIISLLQSINIDLNSNYFNVSNQSDDHFIYVIYGSEESKKTKDFKNETNERRLHLKQAIPLTHGSANNLFNSDSIYNFKDDLFIFLRAESNDPRKDIVDLSHAIENLGISLRNELINLIKQNNLIEKIEFFRNPYNPLPKDVKRHYLYTLLEPHLKNIIFIEDNEQKVFKEFFEDQLCSSVKDKLKCSSHCIWMPKDQQCKIRIPKNVHKTLLARNFDDILNPSFSLKKRPLKNKDFVNDDIIIFSRLDVEDGRFFETIFQSRDLHTKYLGLNYKHVDFDIEAFFTAPISDGRTNSFQKLVLTDNDAPTTLTSSFKGTVLFSNSEREKTEVNKDQTNQKINKNKKDKKSEVKIKKTDHKRTLIPSVADLLPDFKLVPNELYNPMSVFQIFSVVVNYLHEAGTNNSEPILGLQLRSDKNKMGFDVDASQKMKPHVLRSILLNRIEKRFKKNKKEAVQALKDASSLLFDDKKIDQDNITFKDYEQWFQSSKGYVSDFEIQKIGELIDINIVIIKRHSADHPHHVKYLYKSNSPFIVLLVKRKSKHPLGYFTYEIIKKNKNFIFYAEDIPQRFRYILKKSLEIKNA